MARPTWSGSIQISLVTIAVKIFPATNPARQVEFHQIDRETGKRVHHQNVAEGDAVDTADVVKGFEYAKGRYIRIEPEERLIEGSTSKFDLEVQERLCRRSEEARRSETKGQTASGRRACTQTSQRRQHHGHPAPEPRQRQVHQSRKS